MNRKKSYKNHELTYKVLIALTGQADLFPQVGIPRTTANSWIKRGYETDDPVLMALADVLSDAKASSEAAEKEAQELRAIQQLLFNVIESLGFQLQCKHVHDPAIRRKILDAIEAATKVAPRGRCLQAVGLSVSRYKRWRLERKKCAYSKTSRCPRLNASQLTYSEIETMRKLVTSEEFAHFPIRSLHYYAKREDLLHCSYSTWQKYIHLFDWKRPGKKRRRKEKRLVGIRAQRPNEIWHLDISYFILPNKQKYFIQAVIDNYSRYVIAWQVLDRFDSSKTGELLNQAIEKVCSHGKRNQPKLVVDGGGENQGEPVAELERQGLFKKQIARFEISFSNSMIETVFRSAKHNYLYHQNITSFSSLKRHVDFWFKEHNEKIPHTSFRGETPQERYRQTWDDERKIRIMVLQDEALKLRIKENQKVFCQFCG